MSEAEKFTEAATVLRNRVRKGAVVRSGEPVPETGPDATNAAACEFLDRIDQSRGERVAQWSLSKTYERSSPANTARMVFQ